MKLTPLVELIEKISRGKNHMKTAGSGIPHSCLLEAVGFILK